MDATNLQSYSELVEFTLMQLENARTYYKGLASRTDRHGFKTLLLSLIDQKTEHTRRLAEIRNAGNLDSLFKRQSVDLAARDFAMPEPASSGDYLDLLSALIENEQRTVRLYRVLEESCSNADAALLFRHLADDAAKQEAMVRNRRELESL